MILLKQKPDILGTLASSVCLIHCVTTPFIFIVQTGVATHDDAAPIWWKSIDYIFLIISFIAIYWSTQTSSSNWIKRMLWFSWMALSLVIFNEKIELLHLPDAAIYIPAIALVVLHLYNRKYCTRNSDK